MKRIGWVAMAMCVCANAWAGNLQQKRVSLSENRVLVLTVPASWIVLTERSKPGLPLRIKMGPAGAFNQLICVMDLRRMGSGDNRMTEEALLKRMRRYIRDLASRARETDVEPVPFQGTNGVYGYTFHLTDKNPQPGGFVYYRNMGLFLNREVWLEGVILSQKKEDSSLVKEALAVFRTMHIESISKKLRKKSKPASLSKSGKKL